MAEHEISEVNSDTSGSKSRSHAAPSMGAWEGRSGTRTPRHRRRMLNCSNYLGSLQVIMLSGSCVSWQGKFGEPGSRITHAAGSTSPFVCQLPYAKIDNVSSQALSQTGLEVWHACLFALPLHTDQTLPIPTFQPPSRTITHPPPWRPGFGVL